MRKPSTLAFPWHAIYGHSATSSEPKAIMSPQSSVRPPKATISEDDLANSAAGSCIPIAIVGIGFRGPGDAKNVEGLWEMILTGKEAWSPIPATRWNSAAFHHPDHARHGTVSDT